MNSNDSNHEDYMVYGYGRASTTYQKLSLEAQESQISGAAQPKDDGNEQAEAVEQRLKHGDIQGTWGGFFCDTVSTRKMTYFERPQFQLLWTKLHAGDRLIIVALDRVCRSPLESFEFLDLISKKGIRLHILRHGQQEVDFTTPMGRAMAGFLAVFAQWERDMISQRTREAVAQQKANGTYTNGKPRLGYKRKLSKPNTRGRRAVLEYVRDEREWETIREIYTRHSVGEGFQRISDDLRARGVATAEGGVWYSMRVWRAWKLAEKMKKNNQPI
jgi:DNA invertase Pin-like site-specific DNA recombinase